MTYFDDFASNYVRACINRPAANTPAYLAAIQNDLAAILAAAENAAETIETSAEYNDHLHPYHAAAVATYNRICSTLIDLERIKTPE